MILYIPQLVMSLHCNGFYHNYSERGNHTYGTSYTVMITCNPFESYIVMVTKELGSISSFTVITHNSSEGRPYEFLVMTVT